MSESEQLVPVRKALAGSDSFGNTWPKDGSVVKIPYAQALSLVGIQDGGFTIVEPDKGFPEGFPAMEPQDATGQAPVRFVEPHPAPNAENAVVEPGTGVTEPGTAVRASGGTAQVTETTTPEKATPAGKTAPAEKTLHTGKTPPAGKSGA